MVEDERRPRWRRRQHRDAQQMLNRLIKARLLLSVFSRARTVALRRCICVKADTCTHAHTNETKQISDKMICAQCTVRHENDASLRMASRNTIITFTISGIGLKVDDLQHRTRPNVHKTHTRTHSFTHCTQRDYDDCSLRRQRRRLVNAMADSNVCTVCTLDVIDVERERERVCVQRGRTARELNKKTERITNNE